MGEKMIKGGPNPGFDSTGPKLKITGETLKSERYYGSEGDAAIGTVKVYKGIWVYEITSFTNPVRIGWATPNFAGEAGAGQDSWVLRLNDGNLMHNNTDGKGTSWIPSDKLSGKTISTVLDMDNCCISYYANGELLGGGPAFTSVKATAFSPILFLGGSAECKVNFGRKLSYPVEGATAMATETSSSQLDSIKNLFTKYHHDSVTLSESGDRDTIKSQGILNLAKDVHGSEEGMELTLAVIHWKFRASTLWELTKDEWIDGMSLYAIWDMKAFATINKEWLKELDTPHLFKSFYAFLFTFMLQPGKYVLDVPEALETWTVLSFPTKYHELWSKWESFINTKQVISKDAWCMLPLFLSTVGVDMSGFDDGACWPVILEDFAYHIKDQQ